MAGYCSGVMSGSRCTRTSGSPDLRRRSKITASDSLASTNTHGTALPLVVLIDDQDATPASASTVCISTLAPAAQSACVASSSSLWLMPSLQGTNTIAAGITVLRLQASWPAPEVMRRCEYPSCLAAFSTASTNFGLELVGRLRTHR